MQATVNCLFKITCWGICYFPWKYAHTDIKKRSFKQNRFHPPLVTCYTSARWAGNPTRANSTSFVICVNFLPSQPASSLYGLLLSLVFFYLSKLGLPSLKRYFFGCDQNKSTYHDLALLRTHRSSSVKNRFLGTKEWIMFNKGLHYPYDWKSVFPEFFSSIPISFNCSLGPLSSLFLAALYSVTPIPVSSPK